MRRTDRQTDAAFAMSLFKRATWVSVATVGPDGPYVVPMTPIVVNDTIYLHCADWGKRLDNVRYDNRVSIACVDHAEVDASEYSMEYESAIACGNAIIVEDRNEKQLVLKTLSDTLTEHSDEQTLEHIESIVDRTVVIRLALSSVTGKVRKKHREGK